MLPLFPHPIHRTPQLDGGDSYFEVAAEYNYFSVVASAGATADDEVAEMERVVAETKKARKAKEKEDKARAKEAKRVAKELKKAEKAAAKKK